MQKSCALVLCGGTLSRGRRGEIDNKAVTSWVNANWKGVTHTVIAGEWDSATMTPKRWDVIVDATKKRRHTTTL